MAKFPGETEIRYTDRLPSGKSGSVEGSPDVRSGAEMIARAIENAGGVLLKINEAREQTELSTMRRQYDEKTYAAFNTYSTTGDADARKAVVDAWSQDVGQIRSKSGSVNRKFQQYLDRVQPHWAQNFAGQETKLRAQETEVAHKLNLESALRNNDLKGAEKLIREKMQIVPGFTNEGEQQIRDLPVTATFVQARELIGNNEPSQAQEMLTGLKGLKGDQLDTRDRLLGMSERQLTDNADAVGKRMLRDILKVSEMPNIAEREKAAEAMKLAATDPNNGFSVEQARVMINYIDAQIAGADAETDWLGAYEPVRKAIDSIETPQDAQSARFMLMGNFNKLARSEKEELTKLLIDAETAPTENKDYIADANRMGTLGLFDPTDAELEGVFGPDRYRAFSKMDEATQDAFRAAEGIKRKRRLIDEFTAWDKEHGPHTPEQKQKWWDERTKPDKKKKAKRWFHNSFLRRLVSLSPVGAALTIGDIREESKRLQAKKPATLFKHTIRNPQTGERMGSDDGKTWQPIP